MIYQVHITETAEIDLEKAVNYIDFVLKNPTAADGLLDLTTEKLSALAANPELHPVVDDPILNTWGIRFLVINNYLAFYKIDEANHQIHILRFLYNKRNWIAILKNEQTAE